jgi:hypothetical protein
VVDGAGALAAGALLAADAEVLGADALVLGAVDELPAPALDFELEHADKAKAATAAIAVAVAMEWEKRLVRRVMNVPSARVPALDAGAQRWGTPVTGRTGSYRERHESPTAALR